jgi:hypothetical protein
MRRMPVATETLAHRTLRAAPLLTFAFFAACSSTSDCASGMHGGGPCAPSASATATATGTTTATAPTSSCAALDGGCAPSPAPGHPRLWVRAGDLPRLRSWASPQNPIHAELVKIADKRFLEQDLDNPAMALGNPALKTVLQDQGSDIYQADPTSEEYARLLAFLSLVSNDPGKKELYAHKAHDLLMKVINAAAACPLPKVKGNTVPFCSTGFLLRDRASFQGDAYATVLDWLYPYFTAAEKATMQKVFLSWADELTHAMTTAANHPEPVGVFNSPALTSPVGKLRWAGNNYFAAHMKNLGLLALALDPADDPPKDPSQPEMALRNTVRSYLQVATGAYLYMTDYFFRHGGKPQDPKGPSQGFMGSAPEGSLYGPGAMGFVGQLYLALHTAGKDDPALLGPQVVWDGHPHWEKIGWAFLAGLEPSPSQGTTYVGKGPYHQIASYGEVNYESVTVDPILLFGPRGIWAYNTGKAAELNLVRFLEKNIPAGGPEHFLTRVAKSANLHATLDGIFAFLLFDPTPQAPPLTDPRPTLPLVYESPGLGRILARTSWGPEAAFFTYKLGWISIDHQIAEGNQIELYRKGQWLTKGLAGYGSLVGLSLHHNTLAVENSLPHDTYKGDLTPAASTLYPSYQRGSQWMHGAAGDPEITDRSLAQPGTIAVTGDATKLYNLAINNTSAADISHVSRSLVWIEPDHLVVYDRATSKTEGRFKRFFLNTQTLASIAGGMPGTSTGNDADLAPSGAAMSTFSGLVPPGGLLSTALVHPVAEKPKGAAMPEQQLFLTTLLPAKVTVRASPPEALGKEPLTVDPMKFLLQVEATGGPADVRFLHVIQGADAGAAADPVKLLQVSQVDASKSPFEGALVKNTVVLFARRLGEGFAGMSYVAPPGAKHIVTGLGHGAGYTVSKDAGGKVTVSPGGAQLADEGGLLMF